MTSASGPAEGETDPAVKRKRNLGSVVGRKTSNLDRRLHHEEKIVTGESTSKIPFLKAHLKKERRKIRPY